MSPPIRINILEAFVLKTVALVFLQIVFPSEYSDLNLVTTGY